MVGLAFHNWQRAGRHALAVGAARGRAKARLTLTLRERKADGGERTRDGDLEFLMAAPDDVVGLAPGAVRSRVPAPGVRNAEETKLAQIEFHDPGLPWRYTPLPDPTDPNDPAGLRPWLVLIVATAEEFELGAGTVTLGPELRQLYQLSDSHRWAHVQDDGTLRLSRILCPRDLESDTAYRALLLPAFQGEAPDGSAADAWTDTGGGTDLPVLDHWSFRTGPEGDFRTLATRLSPRPTPPSVGLAQVAYERLPGSAPMQVAGALTGLGAAGDPPETAILEDLQALRQPARDDRGRPIVGLPRYGSPWPAVSSGRWGDELNDDPRHRGVAGIGYALGTLEQERFAKLALHHRGAQDVADQRIRHLSMGIAAARSLWRHRLPQDPAAQLFLFGPALRRVVTQSQPLLDRIAAPDRPVGRALFSGAARRALRHGPARTALAATGANRASAVFEAANRCPVPGEAPRGLATPEAVGLAGADRQLHERDPDSVEVDALLEALQKLADSGSSREELPPDAALRLRARVEIAQANGATAALPWVHLALFLAWAQSEPGDPSDAFWDDFLRDWLGCALEYSEGDERWLRCGADGPDPERRLADLMEWVAPLVEPVPAPPCRPVNLDRLMASLLDAFDPTVSVPRAQQRVLGTIDRHDPDQPRAPLVLDPALTLPAWLFLCDHAPNWLLPGIQAMERDAVVALETNARFIAAFMVGLNQQVREEWRWRGLEPALDSTPLRRFWDRRNTSDGRLEDDILPIAQWEPGLALAAHSPTSESELVLLFRSDIFHRYPETIIYLMRSEGGERPPDEVARVYPAFRGRLGADTAFFGFSGLIPEEIRQHWVVLEEPPSGYRFRYEQLEPSALAGMSAASFASRSFADPVRVLIRGEVLAGRPR